METKLQLRLSELFDVCDVYWKYVGTSVASGNICSNQNTNIQISSQAPTESPEV